MDILTNSDVVLRSFAGLASTQVDVTWDLKDGLGLPVLPGVYTMRVTDLDGEGKSGLPYAATDPLSRASISKGSWMRPSGFFPRSVPTP